MDHVVDEPMRDCESLKAITNALSGGVVLVDTEGEVVWMDRATRRRINGELRHLPLPLQKPHGKSVECFAAPVELTVNGQHVNMCVLQQTDTPKDVEGQDLMAALEAIMADSASWFSRTVMEKLKAIGRPAPSANESARRLDLDLLTDREREVLGLICEGKSGIMIGEILGLSENTVRNHIASLYRKIGVNRRSGAIIWARERGIVGRDNLTISRAGRNRERARQARRLLDG